MIHEEVKKLAEFLRNPQKVIVFPHRNPDGDAIGSCLAWTEYLEYRGFEVKIFSSTHVADFLKWLPGFEKVTLFHDNNKKFISEIESADAYFFMDFNALSRIEEIQPYLNKKAKTIMIDHHENPDSFDISISRPDISSTCQLVFHILKDLDYADNISASLATNLYLGMMTDTGSFRHRGTTPETHRAIAHLIEKGADNVTIHRNIYDTNTFSRYQLLGNVLEGMEFLPEFKTCILSLSRKQMLDANFKDGDTEGFVNYGLGLKESVCAIFLKEDKDRIKISFRSKGDFEINALANKYFGGGGHKNAAGGRSFDSLEQTIEDIKKVLPEYKNGIDAAYEKL